MRLLRNWDRFWFEPRETFTIGVIRALTGFILLCFCLLLLPYVKLWYTDSGLVHAGTAMKFNGPDWHFSFLLLSPSSTTTYIVFGLLMLSSITMILGLFSRLSCIVAYLCFLSMAHRNLVILNSGDTMLKLLIFYLCMAPTGASFSLDSRMRRKTQSDRRTGAPQKKSIGQAILDLFVYGPSGAFASPWAQRLIQCQVSLVYCSTVACKSGGPSWHNGTAMWYVYNLAEMVRFPIPGLLHHTFYVNLATWFGLAAEVSMAVLVWFPPTRLIALFLGMMLHLTIEYTMNVPLFSTIMVVAYLSFLDLGMLWNRLAPTEWGRRISQGKEWRVPEGREGKPSRGSALTESLPDGRRQRSS